MRCWSRTGWAIWWRRSPRSPKETSASRASLRCSGGCGAMRSRCPRIWCVSSLMRNRNRWALGRRRARRTPIELFAPSFDRLARARSRTRAGPCGRWRALRRSARRARTRHEPRASRSRIGRGAQCSRALGSGGRCRAPTDCAGGHRFVEAGQWELMPAIACRHGFRLRARTARPLDPSVHAFCGRQRRAAHDSRRRERSVHGGAGCPA